jgi:hypothetical protein
MIFKMNTRALIFFALIVGCFKFLHATEVEWREETLDDGAIKVWYRIYEMTDSLDKEITIIEDKTETSLDKLTLAKSIQTMQNIGSHYTFTGDKSSRLVKALSDTSWIVYYYADNPWPFDDTDCVAKMTMFKDVKNRSVVFELEAAPLAYPLQGVDRMVVYEVSYVFRVTETERLHIAITGKYSPPSAVPKWMLKMAFPEVTAEVLRNLVKQIRQNN